MNDVDIIPLDNFAQGGDVMPHDERAFGMYRQVDVHRTDAFKFVDPAAAI